MKSHVQSSKAGIRRFQCGVGLVLAACLFTLVQHVSLDDSPKLSGR